LSSEMYQGEGLRHTPHCRATSHVPVSSMPAKEVPSLFFMVEKSTLLPESIDAIEAYAWPGNVRELENCAKRAVIMADSSTLRAEDFGLEPALPEPELFSLRRVRDQAERDTVARVLGRVNGNISRAADLLGVSRPTLYDLMEKYGLRT